MQGMAEKQIERVHEADRTTVREDRLKTDLVTRLKRIEGQVKGVTRMVEEDTYCDKILHQISAIRAVICESVKKRGVVIVQPGPTGTVAAVPPGVR